MKYVLATCCAVALLFPYAHGAERRPAPPKISREAQAAVTRIVNRAFDAKVHVMRIGGQLSHLEKMQGKPLSSRYKLRLKAEFAKRTDEVKERYESAYLQLYTEKELIILDKFGKQYPDIVRKQDEAAYRALFYTTVICKEIDSQIVRQEANR